MAVDAESRALLVVSLSVAKVKADDSGNIRLIKASNNNTSRDDVAAALVLAAGAYERSDLPEPITGTREPILV